MPQQYGRLDERASSACNQGAKGNAVKTPATKDASNEDPCNADSSTEEASRKIEAGKRPMTMVDHGRDTQ